MSADIARNLWLLVCSCFNSYCTFHLFPRLILFSNRLLSILNSICQPHFFIPVYDNGSHYICDSQVGYSADGYSLFPRSLLTWYFCPFFQDWLHWWVLTLHEAYNHWSVAVVTVTSRFILFSKSVTFRTEFNLLIPFLLTYMMMDVPLVCISVCKIRRIFEREAPQIFERKVLQSYKTAEKFSNATFFRQIVSQSLQHKNLGFSETDICDG